jgi:hypothetical protein
MKTPHDKVVPFMVVAAIAILVLNIVLRAIASALGLPAYSF